MAKHLLALPRGRCIALQSQDALRRILPPPLFTSSSIDSCVPIHYKKQNKMASFFFPFCKRYSGTKRLNPCGKLNVAKLMIQFCFQLDLSLRLKAEDVIEHITYAN